LIERAEVPLTNNLAENAIRMTQGAAENGWLLALAGGATAFSETRAVIDQQAASEASRPAMPRRCGFNGYCLRSSSRDLNAYIFDPVIKALIL